VDYHQTIRRLHAAGGSLREIAEALRMSHQRVHEIIDEAAEPTRRRRWRRDVQLLSGSVGPCSFCGRQRAGGAHGQFGDLPRICDKCRDLFLEILAQAVPDGRRRRLVVNNGAAGLGTFAGTTHGVITRLFSDSQPPADSLYGITIDTLRCDALPVRFDLATWTDRFLTQWPAGSPAHRSYYTRIIRGTHLQLQQAARNGVQLTAQSEQP
jgi:hypothetical protein